MIRLKKWICKLITAIIEYSKNDLYKEVDMNVLK